LFIVTMYNSISSKFSDEDSLLSEILNLFENSWLYKKAVKISSF
jgi:hypothetical protein